MTVIFPMIIVISLVLYVYYKVAIIKASDGLTRGYYNGKSRICLGSFILFFGINQYVYYQTRLSLFIGIVFILLGCLQLYVGIKESKFYRKEFRRVHPEA
ncbi:YtpI family protein [Virgibacillus sp. 179-BFC.A HS]|uniref:YtpI family protein n=1 Tax=Tigheibacillus jepli TaxID=3035914 RepID=A0ABU5CHA7_9BACI|nr:YtpI family protein [Virgibacillus sp. 179-BFC.A HS]MDY0405341.1 YtpI family protein [Virgibacillus sp. 179-BFC.A HS]